MTSTADVESAQHEIARLRAQLEQRDHCIESFQVCHSFLTPSPLLFPSSSLSPLPQNTVAKLNEKIFGLLMATQELECALRSKDEELAEQAARLSSVAARLSAQDACIEAYQHASGKANERIFNLLMANQELSNSVESKEEELAERTRAAVAAECAAAAQSACVEAYQRASGKANEKLFSLQMANQELENALCAKEEEAAEQASRLACAEARLSAQDACVEAYQVSHRSSLIAHHSSLIAHRSLHRTLAPRSTPWRR